MHGPLRIEHTERVRLLTLQRPQCLNALDTTLRGELAAALNAASRDTATDVVIITGTGDRGFCAGQDLRESAALDAADGPAWMRSWTAYFDALASCSVPIIAAVNGVAAGAGFQTALLADLRVATDEARFLMAEANAGLPAIVGGELLAMHLGRSRATELVLTARTIAAEEALEIGLVHRTTDAPVLLETAFKLAHGLAIKPPAALRLNTARFRALIQADLHGAEAAAERYQTEAMSSGEPQAVMNAFFRRRPDQHPTPRAGARTTTE